MKEFKEELIQILEDTISGILAPEFDLESLPDGKVGGFVISNTFAGKTQLERQNLIWNYLDKRLHKDRVRDIVTLITLTPDEWAEN